MQNFTRLSTPVSLPVLDFSVNRFNLAQNPQNARTRLPRCVHHRAPARLIPLGSDREHDSAPPWWSPHPASLSTTTFYPAPPPPRRIPERQVWPRLPAAAPAPPLSQLSGLWFPGPAPLSLGGTLRSHLPLHWRRLFIFSY